MRKSLALAFLLVAAPAMAQVRPSGIGAGVTPPIFGSPQSAVDASGKVITSQLLLPDGSASAPALSNVNNTNSGMHFTSGYPVMTKGGVDSMAFGSAVELPANGSIGWNSTNAVLASVDVSLSRGAAGRVDTTKAFRMTPVAFASLPTAAEGAIAAVNNSSTNTWGAACDGAGTNHVLCYYNGTSWTVFGK